MECELYLDESGIHITTGLIKTSLISFMEVG